MSSKPPPREDGIPEISDELRQEVIQANYGRDAGWIMVYKGQPVATLTEPGWDDMFWDSYKVTMLVADEDLKSKILSSEFWYEQDRETEFEFHNQRFNGLPLAYSFPIIKGDCYYAPDRVTIRGLYFVIDPPVESEIEPESKTRAEAIWRAFIKWLWP